MSLTLRLCNPPRIRSAQIAGSWYLAAMLDQKIYATIKDQSGLQVRSRHRGYLGDLGISGARSKRRKTVEIENVALMSKACCLGILCCLKCGL